MLMRRVTLRLPILHGMVTIPRIQTSLYAFTPDVSPQIYNSSPTSETSMSDFSVGFLVYTLWRKDIHMLRESHPQEGEEQ